MKTRVLFVDDEPSWRTMVGLFLKLAGFEVLTAKDAASAMPYAGKDDLSAIILDVNLGGENTSTLLQALMEANPDTPIILYSGLDRHASATQQLLKLGADHFLPKGNLQELVNCLEKLCTPSGVPIASLRRPALQTSGWQIV